MAAKKQMSNFSPKKLESARERNRKRKKRGTDEEYNAHLLMQYKSLKLLRMRVKTCNCTI